VIDEASREKLGKIEEKHSAGEDKSEPQESPAFRSSPFQEKPLKLDDSFFL
jgi:hypothetical protein